MKTYVVESPWSEVQDSFGRQLPDRIQGLRRAVERFLDDAGDRRSASIAAYQAKRLADASASFGFSGVARIASALTVLCRMELEEMTGVEEQLRAKLEDLLGLLDEVTEDLGVLPAFE